MTMSDAQAINTAMSGARDSTIGTAAVLVGNSTSSRHSIYILTTL